MSHVPQERRHAPETAYSPMSSRRQRARDAEVALAATPATADSQNQQAFVSAEPAQGDLHRPHPPNTRIIQDRTAEGHTRFLLQRLPGGLYVERQHARGISTQTIQSVLFREGQVFEAWCDEDPLRFEQSSLIHRVRREGLDLLQH